MRMNKRLQKRVISVAVAVMVGAMSGCGSSNYSDIEYMQMGSDALQAGDRNSALIQYKNAVKTNPQNPDARLALAELYLVTGEGSLAVKEIERADRLVTLSSEWRIKLAEAMILSGERDGIDEALSPIASDDPYYPEVLAINGDIALLSQEKELAKEHYEAAQKQDELNVRAQLGLAKLSLFDREYASAEERLGKIIAADASNWKAWELKAAAAYAQKDYPAAISAYDEAIKFEGSSANQLNQHNFSAYMSKAQAMIAGEQYEDAEKLVASLIKQAGKHPTPHFLKGILAYQTKEYRTALESFQQALANSPNYTPVYTLLGASQYILGDFEQANINLGLALNANPNDLYARKLLAAVRLKLGESGDVQDILSPLIDGEAVDAEALAMVGHAAITEGKMGVGLDYLQKAAKAKPGDAGIRGELIRAYFRSGDFDQAIGTLEDIGGNSAKSVIVRAHLSKKNYTEAMKVAGEILKDEPDNPSSYLLMSVVQLSQGDKSAAQENIQKALQKDENNVQARQILAKMALDSSDEQGAARYYNEIIELDEHNEIALLGVAAITARGGDVDAAIQYLEKARKGNEDAIRSRMMLAKYYMNQRKFDQASAIIGEMEGKIPGDPNLLLLQASLAKENGESENALTAINKLIEHSPTTAQLHYEKGLLLAKMSKQRDARDSLKEALKLSPAFLQAKLALAALELQLGADSEAMKLANDMQKTNADNASGYVIAGEIYLKQKQLKKAQNAFQMAFDRAPTGDLAGKLVEAYREAGESYKADAILRDHLMKTESVGVRLALAISLQQNGQLDKAEKEYLAVLQQDKDSLVALNNLAYLNHELDLEKAKEFAERAYKLAPANPMIIDTLGWIHWRLEDADRAEKLLKEAISLTSASDAPDVAYHYAVVIASRGAKEEAILQLEKAVRSNSYFESREAAEQLLSELN